MTWSIFITIIAIHTSQMARASGKPPRVEGLSPLPSKAGFSNPPFSCRLFLDSHHLAIIVPSLPVRYVTIYIRHGITIECCFLQCNAMSGVRCASRPRPGSVSCWQWYCYPWISSSLKEQASQKRGKKKKNWSAVVGRARRRDGSVPFPLSTPSHTHARARRHTHYRLIEGPTPIIRTG